MSPLPPSGDVIVTNDGVTTPYEREVLSEYSTRAFATLTASDHITYVDIYGLENLDQAQFEDPPTSNIEGFTILQNGALRVVGSSPWLPAPFELKFEVSYGESVVDFFITFE